MALERAHHGEPGVRQAGDGGEAGAGRQDDVGGVEAAAVRQDERGPGLDGGHGPRDDVDAVAAAGLDERGEEGAVVHLMVAGDLDAAA